MISPHFLVLNFKKINLVRCRVFRPIFFDNLSFTMVLLRWSSCSSLIDEGTVNLEKSTTLQQDCPKRQLLFDKPNSLTIDFSCDKRNSVSLNIFARFFSLKQDYSRSLPRRRVFSRKKLQLNANEGGLNQINLKFDVLGNTLQPSS